MRARRATVASFSALADLSALVDALLDTLVSALASALVSALVPAFSTTLPALTAPFLAAAFSAGFSADLAAGLVAGFAAAVDLAAGFAAAFTAGLAADFTVGFAADLAAGFTAGFAALLSVAFAFATDFMLSFLGDADVPPATGLGLEVVIDCFVAAGLAAALTVVLVGLLTAPLATVLDDLPLAALTVLTAEDFEAAALPEAGFTEALTGLAAVAATVFFLAVVSVFVLVWRRVVIIVPSLVQVIRVISPPYRRRRESQAKPDPGFEATDILTCNATLSPEAIVLRVLPSMIA